MMDNMPGKWVKGQGWGWVWGEEDEVGALNHMSSESILDAVTRISRGVVYDLGVPIDRNSFLAPSHVATEVIAFRTAGGLKRAGDFGEPPEGLSFHTSMVMLSDHAGTQLDGLCHATAGTDDHWYNGYSTSDWSSDFGPVKAAAENIPSVIAPGVLIDVPGYLGVDELEASYPISAAELEQALAKQETEVSPGDVVCVRTGTMRHWGEAGHDHEALAGPDTAGITLEAAKWLVEECGAMLIAGDTSTLEVLPAVDGQPSPAPVHQYLLIEQGVHMGELHTFEKLAADSVYTFTYIALPPLVRGTTAGFALRPIAIA